MLNYKELNFSPWDISLQKRINKLIAKNQKKKIVYIYERADTSTFRYRVYNITQSLAYSSKFEAIYFFYEELDFLKNYIKNISILVVCRCRWQYKLQSVIDECKKINIPIVFDVDDLVCDINRLPLIMNTLNVRESDTDIDFWTSCCGRIEMTAYKASYFITTNKFLAKILENKFQKPYFIIPNSISEEQYAYSEFLRTIKKPNKKFTLGYFSGTPSHINDFLSIAPEMLDLLEEYKDINLQVVGFMEFPEYLRKFLENKRITLTPLVNFLELQEKISNVDINLIPLVINDFTNSKSELKFFEASIVNTISVATPTYVYKENIKDKKTGFLCYQGSWKQTILDIYNQKYDLANIINQARNYCISKYYVRNLTSQIENVFSNILGYN